MSGLSFFVFFFFSVDLLLLDPNLYTRSRVGEGSLESFATMGNSRWIWL